MFEKFREFDEGMGEVFENMGNLEENGNCVWELCGFWKRECLENWRTLRTLEGKRHVFEELENAWKRIEKCLGSV